MRILLAQNSRYYPSHGGGDKSNRLLMEALAARGHTCLVVARISRFGPEEQEHFLRELAARSVKVDSCESGAVCFRHEGVVVHTVTDHPSLRGYFSDQIARFAPEIILASTDDPAQLLLERALRAETARVVYLVRATLAVPFGPDCAFPSASKTETLRRTDAVVGVSQYVADYVRRWSGIEAVHVPISLIEPGPYAPLGRFENEFVTLVNPCAVKGISIFLALAERMPDVRFAAVPTWGTNEQDRRAIEAHANVTVLPPADNVADILARSRVLLVPSLWAEARSRIVAEAMLHGVPVIASDVGGIPEAKLGVDYLLPVKPIEKYRERVDEQMVPVAEVPEQDIGPWHEALARLLADRLHYDQLSRASRSAAIEYAANLSVEPFERLLDQTMRKPKTSRATETASEPHAADPFVNLSPERRRLVTLRLRGQASPRPAPRATQVDPWFPFAAASADSDMRLFCFPYAGGGAGVFREWAEHLPPGVGVCPARLPGRETRMEEPALHQMEDLVRALVEAIAPYLERPFAFYGHSMGAAVAFELARQLRRRGQPLPRCLIVSGARAPQLRRDPILEPPPTDEELIEEVQRLEGMTKELLENKELIALALPALRADTALYRNYIYADGQPLDCAIRAYGGSDDARITRWHLETWAEQTTRSFSVQMFPGGHFFLRTQRTELLATLARDLAWVTSRG